MRLLYDWIEENPQTDSAFCCDVIYSLYMFDAASKSCLRYINTWFESRLHSTWVFNKRLNRYELKTESELCEIRFGTHGNDRLKERINDLLLVKIKSIVLNRLHKEGVYNNEVVFIIIDLDGYKQGYVVCVRCDDMLIKHLKVITVIDHRQRYFAKNRIITIKIQKRNNQ
jgi:hypothetical protein